MTYSSSWLTINCQISNFSALFRSKRQFFFWILCKISPPCLSAGWHTGQHEWCLFDLIGGDPQECQTNETFSSLSTLACFVKVKASILRSIEEWTSDYKSWYHLMDSTNTALTCVTNGQKSRCDYKYPPRSDQQCRPLYPSVPQCTSVYPGTGHNPPLLFWL